MSAVPKINIPSNDGGERKKKKKKANKAKEEQEPVEPIAVDPIAVDDDIEERKLPRSPRVLEKRDPELNTTARRSMDCAVGLCVPLISVTMLLVGISFAISWKSDTETVIAGVLLIIVAAILAVMFVPWFLWRVRVAERVKQRQQQQERIAHIQEAKIHNERKKRQRSRNNNNMPSNRLVRRSTRSSLRNSRASQRNSQQHSIRSSSRRGSQQYLDVPGQMPKFGAKTSKKQRRSSSLVKVHNAE